MLLYLLLIIIKKSINKDEQIYVKILCRMFVFYQMEY